MIRASVLKVVLALVACRFAAYGIAADTPIAAADQHPHAGKQLLLDRAIADAEQIVRASDRWDALMTIASCQLSLGQTEKAKETAAKLEAQVEESGKSNSRKVEIATLHVKCGDLKSARRVLGSVMSSEVRPIDVSEFGPL